MHNIIHVLYFYLNIVESIISPNIIIDMTDQFRIFNPTIIVNDTDYKTSDRINLFKAFIKHGQEVSFNYEDSKRNQSFIIFSQMKNFNWKIHTEISALVVTKIENDSDLDHLNILFCAEVYFIDYDTLKVYESYTINKMGTTKYLGKFKEENNHMTFMEAADFNPSFVKRRGNFQGLQLTGNYTFYAKFYK